jgi:hypothetical protein
VTVHPPTLYHATRSQFGPEMEEIREILGPTNHFKVRTSPLLPFGLRDWLMHDGILVCACVCVCMCVGVKFSMSLLFSWQLSALRRHYVQNRCGT